jgi:hypothetical protein
MISCVPQISVLWVNVNAIFWQNINAIVTLALVMLCSQWLRHETEQASCFNDVGQKCRSGKGADSTKLSRVYKPVTSVTVSFV